MIRVHVVVEGQSEETFVRDLLVSHFAARGVYLYAKVFRTSPGHRGGISRYARVKDQLVRLCRQDRTAFVTTLIDLYALPADFPGYQDNAGLPAHRRAGALERAMRTDIDEARLIPNLLVHEFEALLFSDIAALKPILPQHGDAIDRLSATAAHFESPEHINDSPQTAPSKRLLALPGYQKSLHGSLVAQNIGLDSMRRHCSHFNAWCHRIEQLATNTEGQP